MSSVDVNVFLIGLVDITIKLKNKVLNCGDDQFFLLLFLLLLSFLLFYLLLFILLLLLSLLYSARFSFIKFLSIISIKKRFIFLQ